MAEQRRIKTEDIQSQMVISVDLESGPHTGTVTTVMLRGTVEGTDAMIGLDSSEALVYIPVDAEITVISGP